MRNPANNYSYYQHKKYQQRSRYFQFPEEEIDCHGSGILNCKNYHKSQQKQCGIHFNVHKLLSFQYSGIYCLLVFNCIVNIRTGNRTGSAVTCLSLDTQILTQLVMYFHNVARLNDPGDITNVQFG